MIELAHRRYFFVLTKEKYAVHMVQTVLIQHSKLQGFRYLYRSKKQNVSARLNFTSMKISVLWPPKGCLIREKRWSLALHRPVQALCKSILELLHQT
jgi:hypothetical protein